MPATAVLRFAQAPRPLLFNRGPILNSTATGIRPGASRPAETGFEVSFLLEGNFARVKFGYTGHRLEERTGHWSALHRQLDPRAGRWTQMDPAGTVDGQNRFPYTMSSPMSQIDPTGLFATIGVRGRTIALSLTIGVQAGNNLPSEYNWKRFAEKLGPAVNGYWGVAARRARLHVHSRSGACARDWQLAFNAQIVMGKTGSNNVLLTTDRYSSGSPKSTGDENVGGLTTARWSVIPYGEVLHGFAFNLHDVGHMLGMATPEGLHAEDTPNHEWETDSIMNFFPKGTYPRVYNRHWNWILDYWNHRSQLARQGVQMWWTSGLGGREDGARQRAPD